MPSTPESLALIRLRHPEWRENQIRWRWLLDSLEGGERYRQAVYGHDLRGLSIRNLIRHKREYPDPRESGGSFVDPSLFGVDRLREGDDPAFSATDDDYELRRARTPVPTFVAEAIDTHLSRIYAREVRREGPERLSDWWADVDGCGSSIDQWMAETVAPLLLTLGQLDLAFDHPAAPEGEEVETRADSERLGLDRCVGSYILPENMLWWRLDPTGHRYAECLVREYHEEVQGPAERYRYWTAEDSTLYDPDGEVIATTPHSFGRVPIIRVFDRRKPLGGGFYPSSVITKAYGIWRAIRVPSPPVLVIPHCCDGTVNIGGVDLSALLPFASLLPRMKPCHRDRIAMP